MAMEERATEEASRLFLQAWTNQRRLLRNLQPLIMWLGIKKMFPTIKMARNSPALCINVNDDAVKGLSLLIFEYCHNATELGDLDKRKKK